LGPLEPHLGLIRVQYDWKYEIRRPHTQRPGSPEHAHNVPASNSVETFDGTLYPVELGGVYKITYLHSVACS
jgi:hypothetical protein